MAEEVKKEKVDEVPSNILEKSSSVPVGIKAKAPKENKTLFSSKKKK